MEAPVRPGDLLVGKIQRNASMLVLSVQVQSLPIGWRQVHVLGLCGFNLHRLSMQWDTFLSSWEVHEPPACRR